MGQVRVSRDYLIRAERYGHAAHSTSNPKRDPLPRDTHCVDIITHEFVAGTTATAPQQSATGPVKGRMAAASARMSAASCRPSSLTGWRPWPRRLPALSARSRSEPSGLLHAELQSSALQLQTYLQPLQLVQTQLLGLDLLPLRKHSSGWASALTPLLHQTQH